MNPVLESFIAGAGAAFLWMVVYVVWTRLVEFLQRKGVLTYSPHDKLNYDKKAPPPLSMFQYTLAKLRGDPAGSNPER